MKFKNYQSRFSLVEVLFALTVLSIALLGMIVTINTLQIMKKNSKEMLIASNTASEKLERLRTFTIAEAKNAIDNITISPADPLSLELTTINGGGLNRINNPAIPLISFQYFPDEANTPLGPLDMDLDGLTTTNAGDGTNDASEIAAYRFLPVQVTIRWRSYYGQRDPVSGENFQEYVFNTMLAEESLE